MTVRELIHELLELPEERLDDPIVVTKAAVSVDTVQMYYKGGDLTNRVRIY